jgi:hypothetical protein
MRSTTWFMSPAGRQSARILSLTARALNPKVSQTSGSVSSDSGSQNTHRQAMAAEYMRSLGPDLMRTWMPRLDRAAIHRHMRTVLAIMATRKSFHFCSSSSGGFHSSPSMITALGPRKSRYGESLR